MGERIQQGAAPTGPEPSRTSWQPIADLKHDGDAENEAVCGFWAGPVLVYVPDAHGGVMLVAQCDAGDWLVGDETRCFGDMLKQPTHFMPLPPAPCDGSPEGSETRSGSTEGNSAVPAGQAPQWSKWADAEEWERRARNAEAAGADLLKKNEHLTTALAESERKRVEAEDRLSALIAQEAEHGEA